jgi:pentatricopeptide repeat protein
MTFREYRRYMEENPQLQDQHGQGNHRGGRGGGRRGGYQGQHGGHGGGGAHIIKGMDIQALVDRLQRAHNQEGVARELEVARDKHREVFESGKALTAIISSVARRRNMNLAKAIWDWIDYVGIQKNTFHYNSMISACEKVKDYRKALNLMDEMKQKNISKNEVT